MSYARKNPMSSGHNAYKQNEVDTTSPGKLIVMLYEGAIRFLTTASENVDFKKYDFVNENVQKTHDIIDELISSLNMDEGGEVAKNLLSIYLYMKQQITDGNLKKDPKPFKEVIKMLNELKQAWEEIQKKESTTRTSAPVTRPGGLSIQG